MAKKPIEVETLNHREAARKNIPTAEFESLMRAEDKSPIQLAYARRNRDLDPQLVWRGKDMQDWSDLIVQAPPLYIQEKLHPKAIIDDLRREAQARAQEQAREKPGETPDLFADFNGLPDIEARAEFYQHDQHWSNRMIAGDSLSVMASLAEREGLRGRVQCIYFDPPYGIKFNSNFQWSTTSRDVKDGARDQITREPEQVRAFRDTWRDGIHSYLTYLRDRLTVARDLLTESGSIFVQIGDENVHRVRSLMDEVFGEGNFCSLIQVQKTGSQAGNLLAATVDFVLWYSRSKEKTKYRQLYNERIAGHVSSDRYDQIELTDGTERRLSSEELNRIGEIPEGRIFRQTSLISSGQASQEQKLQFQKRNFLPGSGSHWKTTIRGLDILAKAGRITAGKSTVRYKRYINDFSVLPITDRWESMQIGTGLIYVVQTSVSIIERCILMTTDPGDLVLDPTCGSGTTAYVAEQWGRRWITIDTSRVAIALARSRLMGARYPYYLLADSPEGQRREAEVTRSVPSAAPTQRDIRLGFVYERVPHITLKSIANNAEIDVIWEKWQQILEPLRATLNASLRSSGSDPQITQITQITQIKQQDDDKDKVDTSNLRKSSQSADNLKTGWEEWEIPREADPNWPEAAKAAHAKWWEARISRQREIDASIAAKAEFETLYDKPYDDKSRIRVAGPFTVESLSPHRILAMDEMDELIDPMAAPKRKSESAADFAGMILENLRAAGVQQAHKEDRIGFVSLSGWPGRHICAEGVFMEGETQKRAGIFIGPEFGTVSRPDLVAAAREAGDAGFDMLVACAFSYDAHSAEFGKLGRVPVLKARMNPDLHMADALKATGAGNLFVVFGEPDIRIDDAGGNMIRVKVFGVDVFKPQSGEVISEGTDGIALWMIDTDYNEESFFVRHAYFLGANDPYKALKTTLKAEIDEAAWSSLNSDTSRPFPKPKSGRIAVKVINHLGDEVMKVFGVA